MIFSHQSQQGFTLVETLVAITILLIVITGPLTISTATARSTSFSSEQVVAFFLAQEGAEIVQKGRDDVLINYFLPVSDINHEPFPWVEVMGVTSGTYANCYLPAGCGLELITNNTGEVDSPVECDGLNCLLYLNNSILSQRAEYTHDSLGNDSTIFTRVIKLTEISDYEVQVESVVSWRTGGQREIQEVKVQTYLYDVYGS
jgi:prepilin-type N-terminal cleavage/methylation domain-containing protein